MSSDTRQLVPYSEAPDYPSFDDATGFAEDFRTGAAGAYIKDERWAKYWWTSRLDILATQLQEGIFAVVAYPPAGFQVAYASDIEEVERFRGWILEYQAQPPKWILLAASQEVGIDEFIRLRREYKAG